MKLKRSQRSRCLSYAASAVVLGVLATAVTGVTSANQADPQTLLRTALRLSDLYNWHGAAVEFTEAERLFTLAGNERGALHARLGRLRATVEQNERGLLALSSELADELETNPLLKS